MPTCFFSASLYVAFAGHLPSPQPESNLIRTAVVVNLRRVVYPPPGRLAKPPQDAILPYEPK
jgi:hypothetical protein